jgi:hypothetical protein
VPLAILTLLIGLVILAFMAADKTSPSEAYA